MQSAWPTMLPHSVPTAPPAPEVLVAVPVAAEPAEAPAPVVAAPPPAPVCPDEDSGSCTVTPPPHATSKTETSEQDERKRRLMRARKAACVPETAPTPGGRR